MLFPKTFKQKKSPVYGWALRLQKGTRNESTNQEIVYEKHIRTIEFLNF